MPDEDNQLLLSASRTSTFISLCSVVKSPITVDRRLKAETVVFVFYKNKIEKIKYLNDNILIFIED